MALKKRKSKLTDLFPERENLRLQPIINNKTNTIRNNGQNNSNYRRRSSKSS